MIRVRKLVPARAMHTKTSPIIPSFGAKNTIGANMIKHTKKINPAIRPLSSKVVESVKKAWQVGNPSPKDIPSSILQNKENSSP